MYGVPCNNSTRYLDSVFFLVRYEKKHVAQTVFLFGRPVYVKKKILQKVTHAIKSYIYQSLGLLIGVRVPSDPFNNIKKNKNILPILNTVETPSSSPKLNFR